MVHKPIWYKPGDTVTIRPIGSHEWRRHGYMMPTSNGSGGIPCTMPECDVCVLGGRPLWEQHIIARARAKAERKKARWSLLFETTRRKRSYDR